MPKIKKQKDSFELRKNKVKNNKHYFEYIERSNSNPNITIAVYCKGCGSKIKGLNKEGNSLIEYSNYREVLIEFDDGSRHLTPICNSCINIKSKDDLDAMYMADLDELDKEDDGKDNKIWDYYLNRKPEKIKR